MARFAAVPCYFSLYADSTSSAAASVLKGAAQHSHLPVFALLPASGRVLRHSYQSMGLLGLLSALAAVDLAAAEIAEPVGECQLPHGAGTTSALIQHASNVQKGLGLHEGLGLQQGKGERRQGHSRCAQKQKMLWLSSISLAPQCEHTESYMDQYEIALISWKESGNHNFQPMLICHLPSGTTAAGVTPQHQTRLTRIQKLGQSSKWFPSFVHEDGNPTVVCQYYSSMFLICYVYIYIYTCIYI